ncbi:EpsG family protein [Chryseobacterium sp.]|uniref:EpsG family protein n=1 Tax=Chryseobacterium sp. TaxID=1871047 RepID=UPI0011CBFFEE|nr:EpsG family protein [Chryseobacterium sp.]TXF77557.1 EpsG family protein [Chryseobacterium sp.]
MENFNTLYNTVIIFIAFVALYFSAAIDIKKRNFTKTGLVFAFATLVALLLLFGLRDKEIGTDTLMYYWQYKNYRHYEQGTDFLMGFVFTGLNQFSNDPTLYFFVMAFLYLATFGFAFFYYARSLGSNVYLVLFSFISLFFFEAMGINTIRQGVSLGFFALALSQYYKEPVTFFKKSVIIFAVLSVGFHLTGLIPVILFLLVISLRKIRLGYYYFLYFFTLVLSVFSVSILTFKDYIGFLLIDERRSGYLEVAKFSKLYSIGFKPQFVAFNTLFLLFFVYIRKFVYVSDGSTQLFKYYLLSSSLFFMVFQLPYSDRWGVMSWVVIPFLLVPLFKVGTGRRLATATVLLLTAIFLFFLSYQSK